MTTNSLGFSPDGRENHTTAIPEGGAPQDLVRQQELLAQVNRTLHDLDSEMTYRRLPTIGADITQALSGAKIVMVDDSNGALSHWMPKLITATNGTAECIYYTEVSRKELIEQIIEKNPAILLLDDDLAGASTGSSLVPRLRELLPNCLLIGFSSSSSSNDLLREAGVDETADKGSADTGAALSKLSLLYSQHVRMRAESEQKEALIEIAPPESATISEVKGGNLAAAFEASLGERAVVELLDTLSSYMRLRGPEKSHSESGNDDERRVQAQKLYHNIMNRLLSSFDSNFARFLATAGSLMYFDTEARNSLVWDGDYYAAQKKELEKVVDLIIKYGLADVKDFKVINSAAHGEKFAFLFNHSESGRRRIITHDSKIELADVQGYNYLDISPTGVPFARSVTNRGGGRAFFDGERLMSHERFQTCAPKVSFFNGGYIVNSTGCSIVNGMLYPLINQLDKVAHSTGAFCGMPDYTNAEAVESYRANDGTAKRLLINDVGVIHLGDQRIKPIGIFQPSKRFVAENGFTQFEWSEYCDL